MKNRQADEPETADLSGREAAAEVIQNRSRPPQSRLLLAAWILLLVLGALFVFASLSDLVADARSGLPTDHTATFNSVTAITWSSAPHAAPGITRYITLLETTYAVHELVFGLLFLLIVASPVRRRARWAWWACWVPMLANLTYTFTFGRSGGTTLVYSLIADIALPVLLLLHIPAFFGPSARRTRSS